ncbi:MAG TPA: peptidoglycan-binding domain-containing protein, partial [Solirubrobacteraceae bacterium]
MPLIAPRRTQPPKPQQPQNRGGGTAGGQFAALHPRGRGGKWIAKPGDGYGPQGPHQTTAQLQQRLNQLGFHVPIDGKYGPATANAVQTFQKRYGLSPSKGVDAATMAFLQNPPARTIAQIQKSKATSKSTGRVSAKTASAGTPSTRTPSTSTSSSRSTKAITPAQAAQQLTVTADTKAAIKAEVAAASETHQAGTDTNVKTAQHDAAQAQGDAARAQKLADAAKAAAVGGTAQAKKTAKSAERVAKTAQKDAKGAIKAVKALKQQIAKQKAARIAADQALMAGEYAGLARGKPRAPAGKSASMKLTAPKKGSKAPSRTGKVQVATSAENSTERPDLEEGTWTGGNGVADTTTVAFGYGGDPSMAIPDGREQTPDSDRPIWTRSGVRLLPSYTIPDGRTAPVPPGMNFTILDGRNVPEALTVQLVEAVAARKAAKTGQEFTRALARERVLREWLQEAFWNQSLHPRGRGGKWANVMNKLMGAP